MVESKIDLANRVLNCLFSQSLATISSTELQPQMQTVCHINFHKFIFAVSWMIDRYCIYRSVWFAMSHMAQQASNLPTLYWLYLSLLGSVQFPLRDENADTMHMLVQWIYNVACKD